MWIGLLVTCQPRGPIPIRLVHVPALAHLDAPRSGQLSVELGRERPHVRADGDHVEALVDTGFGLSAGRTYG